MINTNNLIKYLILFIVTSTATKVIPTCGVLKRTRYLCGVNISINICFN